MDKLISKYIGRKFLVFTVGTVAWFFDKMDTSSWLILACVYMGIEGGLHLGKPFIEKLMERGVVSSKKSNSGDKLP